MLLAITDLQVFLFFSVRNKTKSKTSNTINAVSANPAFQQWGDFIVCCMWSTLGCIRSVYGIEKNLALWPVIKYGWWVGGLGEVDAAEVTWWRWILHLTKLEEEISWSGCCKHTDRQTDRGHQQQAFTVGVVFVKTNIHVNTFKTKTTWSSKEGLENVVGIKIWQKKYNWESTKPLIISQQQFQKYSKS